MEEQTDKVFIKNVSIVIVLLIVFTFSIAFLARDVGFKEEAEQPQSCYYNRRAHQTCC